MSVSDSRVLFNIPTCYLGKTEFASSNPFILKPHHKSPSVPVPSRLMAHNVSFLTHSNLTLTDLRDRVDENFSREDVHSNTSKRSYKSKSTALSHISSFLLALSHLPLTSPCHEHPSPTLLAPSGSPLSVPPSLVLLGSSRLKKPKFLCFSPTLAQPNQALGVIQQSQQTTDLTPGGEG